jgi:predicted thioredoxin/glutaredoxin
MPKSIAKVMEEFDDRLNVDGIYISHPISWPQVEREVMRAVKLRDDKIKVFILQSISQMKQDLLTELEEKLPKETPKFGDFMRELEWNEKHRNTDSQLYNKVLNKIIKTL